MTKETNETYNNFLNVWAEEWTNKSVCQNKEPGNTSEKVTMSMGTSYIIKVSFKLVGKSRLFNKWEKNNIRSLPYSPQRNYSKVLIK